MRRRGNKSRIPAYTPIRIHIHTDTYVYVYRQKMHVDIHEERVYIESIEYAEKEREGILKCFWRTVADKNRLAHCERGRARGRIKMHGARVIVSLCLIRMELGGGGREDSIRFDCTSAASCSLRGKMGKCARARWISSLQRMRSPISTILVFS